MSELDELRRENAALRARLALDEQLESDAKRYEAIVATLDEGVVLHTRDGNIATCNAAAERILGLTVEQMMGRDSMDERWRAVREDGTPFPGDEHPAMVTLRTGEAQLRVVMGVHKPDGELTWIRITSQPLFAKDEAEPYAALATFTDITELKRAEQEQRRGAERLALALGAARLGTWEWSIADDVVSWSPEVETMFGVAPGGFGGTFEGYLALVHRDDQEALRARLEAAIEAPSSSSHFQVVHRIERDGRIAWIEGWGRVLRNERGEPVRMTGTVADITQRKSLEQQFLRAQRMETVGRLAGGVAHDFNNLLTAILGSVDLAEMAEIDDPTVDEALATIRMSSERAARLTTQLLAFARKGMVQLETLDLGTLVVDTYELMRRLLGAGVEISVVVPDSAVYVKADRGQVEQVLVNLAVNARDAMPSGGALRIAVRSDPGGSVAALEVSDDGAGMDEHVRERLFEPFFTTKEGRSGLGLASCYGIIQQLGGEIHVESKRGAGTTFRIQLPSARPSAIESLLEGEGQGTRLGGAERVLIVDDEPTIADVLERTMVAAGYEVTLCDNGVEALSLVEGGLRPDVVVTDVVMPHMGGTQLSERLTAIAPDLPIVFISGYTEDRAPSSGPRRSFSRSPSAPETSWPPYARPSTKRDREVRHGPHGPTMRGGESVANASVMSVASEWVLSGSVRTAMVASPGRGSALLTVPRKGTEAMKKLVLCLGLSWALATVILVSQGCGPGDDCAVTATCFVGNAGGAASGPSGTGGSTSASSSTTGAGGGGAPETACENGLDDDGDGDVDCDDPDCESAGFECVSVPGDRVYVFPSANSCPDGTAQVEFSTCDENACSCGTTVGDCSMSVSYWPGAGCPGTPNFTLTESECVNSNGIGMGSFRLDGVPAVGVDAAACTPTASSVGVAARFLCERNVSPCEGGGGGQCIGADPTCVIVDDSECPEPFAGYSEPILPSTTTSCTCSCSVESVACAGSVTARGASCLPTSGGQTVNTVGACVETRFSVGGFYFQSEGVGTPTCDGSVSSPDLRRLCCTAGPP